MNYNSMINGEFRVMCAMIPALIKDFEGALTEAKVKPDAAAAFFQLLFVTGQRMKKNPNYAPGIPREERWRPVSSETFKRIAGGDYKKVIRGMIKLHWIQVRKNNKADKELFKPGKFTKLYRIHPSLTTANETKEPLRAHIITDIAVRRGIIRQKEFSAEKREKLLKEKHHLIKPVHKQIIKHAEMFMLDENRLMEDRLVIEKKLKEKRKGKNLRTFDDLFAEAVTFNNGDALWLNVDDFGHRLHFPLTNQDSLLRPYLHLKSKPDAELMLSDMKNAQPFLLSCLMVKPGLVAQYVPEFLQLIPELEKRMNSVNVKSFHYDCHLGLFYQKFAGADKLDSESKARLKEELFKNVFYGRPRDPFRLQAKEMRSADYTPGEEHVQKVKAILKFKLLYPVVWENIYYLKKQKSFQFPFFQEIENKGEEPKGMYTLFNCLAQRFESALVFELARRAFEEKIKVVTIHDAFITEARHTDRLHAIIDNFFRNELKVLPPSTEKQLINSMRQ